MKRWMREATTAVIRAGWVWIIVLLAGCDASSSAKFIGAAETRTTLNGRDFTVFHDANRVEVLRLGWADRADREDMMDQMVLAAEQATGCRVKPASVEGDSGVLRARLTCPT